MLEIRQFDYEVGGRCLLQVPHLDLYAGQFTVIVGPNGAGKSTLLKGISGDLNRSRDGMRLHHHPVSQWPATALARHLGFLPQHSQLAFGFAATDVVAMGAYPLRLSAQQQADAVTRAMDATDTLGLRDKSYLTLSGGEKQRVQLARVLLQLSQAESPPLLLLDEPTSALDLAQQHRLCQRMRQLAHQRQYGVVAVLHDLNLAHRYADRVLVVEQGRLVADGPPETVLDLTQVADTWGYQGQVLAVPGCDYRVIV